MNNIKEFNTANKGSNSYKIIIVVLAIILVGLGYLYYDQQRKTEKKIAELNQVTQEKEVLSFQYQNLLDDFESIETSNDSISNQLNQEKEKIKELISKLRITKAENKTQITKYKNELKTLRNIMKGFIHQIDSLNTLNTELTAENKEIKKQYQSARKKNKQLSDQYDEAADKVKIASVIKAVGISIESYNHKGKPTTRAKKTKRFGISFSLDENAIAPIGTKNIYLRITDPGKHILIQNNLPVFSYEGEEIAYSSVRQVEYDGSLTNAIVYFEHKGDLELSSGTYRVDIFCDGNMIGSTTIDLN